MGTFLSAANDTFILSDSQNAYFTAQVYSISELPAIIALSESTSFVTALGRVLRCDPDERKLFQHNFLPGDHVIIRGDHRPITLEIAGFGDGAVWARTPASRSVLALPPLKLAHRVISIDRPGHTLSKMTIDGFEVWVDTTQAFCARFGYGLGI
jgi:hypothetical protein